MLYFIDDILDTSNIQFIGDFDVQVQEILSYVRLTAERVHGLKLLFDDLEFALQQLSPGKVSIYIISSLIILKNL